MSSVPRGRSWSACQTIPGSAPLDCRRARAASPSRLMPGKRITAARIDVLCDLDCVILNDGVGEQPLASLAQRPARGCAILAVELDIENLALAHAFEALDGEALEGALDRFALGIEDAGFQSDDDARFQGLNRSWLLTPRARSAPWSRAHRAPSDLGSSAIARRLRRCAVGGRSSPAP